MPEKEPEKKELISGTFTVEEMVKLIHTMAESNKDALKEFAVELASKIAHPDPSPAQIEQTRQQLRLRIERAREEDLLREAKRKNCVHPARPAFPHRRYGTEWGMFAGSSVIAWHYTTFSTRTPSGGSTEGMQVALGVCQWCGTEFKPGDPDYEEALSWGLSTAIGTYPMNQRTGIWA